MFISVVGLQYALLVADLQHTLSVTSFKYTLSVVGLQYTCSCGGLAVRVLGALQHTLLVASLQHTLSQGSTLLGRLGPLGFPARRCGIDTVFASGMPMPAPGLIAEVSGAAGLTRLVGGSAGLFDAMLAQLWSCVFFIFLYVPFFKPESAWHSVCNLGG